MNLITCKCREAARYTSIALLLLFAACTKNEHIDLPSLNKGDNITFRTETIDNFTTRSAGYTTNGNTAILSMGIYAAYTENAWTNAAPLNYFSNIPVERLNTSAPWLYSPEQWWPGSGHLSFFGYAPHSDNPIYENNKPTISTTGNGIPTINYTIASSHNEQVDLLVATPVKNQTKRDNVTIPLHHALTKIAFSARVAKEPIFGTSYRVTSVTLRNLHGSGTVTMSSDNRTWTPTSPADQQYTQTTINGGLKILPLTTTYQPLTPTTGHLFLMPQLLDDAAEVSITYVTQVGLDPEMVKTFSLKLPDAITQFRSGEAYNLMFVIDNGITLIVAPTPWDNTTVEADIKNRILNITRIEASVYPGVATRIHFWSNQPKDSVYVRTIGNLDDGNKYPLGTQYTVNEAFQNLSGLPSAGYIPNIRYLGFDGNTTSGEGYIDVMHTNSTTTPFNPILPDADQRHIWLNAAGLARNILLTTIDRANRTTTPYIGTFHRWNESGERIVTWGYNGTWTASVLDEPAGTNILLDRQPSPYMTTGQLYGTGNVGDPEAAQLHRDSINKTINGTGRIYFRVGLTSTLANRGTMPRYGRIQVQEKNSSGTIINTRILYVRQGELEDYIMRPNDPNGASASARPYAIKFSPYNLTAPNIGSGGTAPTNHPQLAVNGGSFTQYPTQAGAYFAWAPATDKNNHRRALHPQNPTFGIGITNWNATASSPSSTWNTHITTHETCPPGYRRPFHESITTSVSSSENSEFKQSLYRYYLPEDYQSNDTYLNRIFGYYADGFFDRRTIVSDVQVNSGNATVAYIGGLFYNPTTHASLFFPAAGRRNDLGFLYFGSSSVGLGLENNTGFYSSSGRENSSGNNIYMHLHKGGSGVPAWYEKESLSIRCVRDLGFTTDLNPDTEILVPTSISFNANSSDIKATTIEEYTNYIIASIGSIENPETKEYNIRARVTFIGTVTATGITANTNSLLTHPYIGSGSTITYDFNHSSLTWDNTSIPKLIQIGVTNANWEYQTNNGAWITGGATSSATLNTKGKIILRKK